MTTDRTHHYAQAVVALAEAEGALGAVEDELLAVARAVDGNDELRRKLTDQHLPVGQRLTFAESAALAAAHPRPELRSRCSSPPSASVTSPPSRTSSPPKVRRVATPRSPRSTSRRRSTTPSAKR